MHSNSQEIFTKELRWITGESITMPNFQDTSQIIEWGKSISPFTSVQSEKLSIENNDVLILQVDKCSGIYCPTIYIFRERKKHWELVASSHARLKDPVEINVDTNKKKLIFITKSGQIGELHFETMR
jgi:hypothetical protein